jgi:hypothetical protein
MQKLAILLLLPALLVGAQVSAQQKVSEKDVVGKWKLVIDLGETMEREAEQADSFLAEVIISATSGILEGILGNMDIQFDFRKNKDVVITVNAFGKTDESTTTWFINAKGYLQIQDVKGKRPEVRMSSDDEWLIKDGKLLTKAQDEDVKVYLTRVN